MKRVLLSALIAGLLAGCGVISRGPPTLTYAQRMGLGPVFPEVREVQTPEVGVRATAAVGMTMVSHARLTQDVALRVKSDVAVRATWDSDYDYSLTLPAGLRPLSRRDTLGNEYFPGSQKVQLAWILKNKTTYHDLVLADLRLNRDGTVDVIWAYPGDAYDVREVRAPNAEVERILMPPVEVPNSFRRELVYTGRAGGTLSLLYREFSGDMARPAFTQALQYDISADPVIGYQGARFRVISADNTGITYEVLAPLAPR